MALIRRTLIAAVPLVAAAAATTLATHPTPTVEYEAAGTVLQRGSDARGGPQGPQLCFTVLQSLPPECGGLPLVGWEWSGLPGITRRGGVTWGDYVVRGRYDGATIMITGAPRALTPADRRRAADPMHVSTPCRPPHGGWARSSASGIESASIPARRHAERSPYLSAIWFAGPSDAPVLNVRFVAGAARERVVLRHLFGGNLCVTQGGISRARLARLARRVWRLVPDDQRVSSAADELTGRVRVLVVLDDGTLQRALDRAVGPGIAVVRSELRPVG